MIRLVTFDLYQTLCYAVPDRCERLAAACQELGFVCQPDDFVRPDVEAEELYTVENGRLPMHLRSPHEQAAFYRRAMQLRLRGAGLPHDDETAERLRAGMELRRAVEWRLFDDVHTTFAALRERRLRIGVISNTPVDATILCTELGVCERVDFVVSSCLVGCEKPCRRIFQAALDAAGVTAASAVHVGDQPRSDALGAVGAGLHTLLLDRAGLLGHETQYRRIGSLEEVVTWIDAPTAARRGRERDGAAPANDRPGRCRGRACLIACLARFLHSPAPSAANTRGRKDTSCQLPPASSATATRHSNTTSTKSARSRS